MALPRSQYVQEGQEGVYHCFSRCVRRAFLCGFDTISHKDFSHRKAWLVDRLRHLAAIFAIEVCAYAVMETHHHTILRTRPDIVAQWSDQEVATRWLTLFPRNRNPGGSPNPPSETEICALADCPERLAQLRRRLSSLSWFMGQLNEFIARAANREDGVKGRFWESRFKCQALLDEAAIAACMVYVDLNPIRAGLAGTPEESDFTSIQARILAWQRESVKAQDNQMDSFGSDIQSPGSKDHISNPVHDRNPTIGNASDSSGWLCPIQSDTERRGILGMTAMEYFDLVDRSGRMMRSDKRGLIDGDLVPILRRMGINPAAWTETVTHFGSRFRLAAGLLVSLRRFANQLGRRWLMGVTAARVAFAVSPA